MLVDNEATVDYDPYVVQPEPLPTNGRHAILEFRCVVLLSRQQSG